MMGGLIASQQGHVNVARLLIEAGADIDMAEDNGVTPLCIASHRGRVEIVRVLLDGGADAILATNKGITP
jgi:ankyrin repeat protein